MKWTKAMRQAASERAKARWAQKKLGRSSNVPQAPKREVTLTFMLGDARLTRTMSCERARFIVNAFLELEV